MGEGKKGKKKKKDGCRKGSIGETKQARQRKRKRLEVGLPPLDDRLQAYFSNQSFAFCH